jgi:hypothetical protein
MDTPTTPLPTPVLTVTIGSNHGFRQNAHYFSILCRQLRRISEPDRSFFFTVCVLFRRSGAGRSTISMAEVVPGGAGLKAVRLPRTYLSCDKVPAQWSLNPLVVARSSRPAGASSLTVRATTRYRCSFVLARITNTRQLSNWPAARPIVLRGRPLSRSRVNRWFAPGRSRSVMFGRVHLCLAFSRALGSSPSHQSASHLRKSPTHPKGDAPRLRLGGLLMASVPLRRSHCSPQHAVKGRIACWLR